MLLSVGEHKRLMAELRGIVETDPTLVPRAAREALRFTPLPEVLLRGKLHADDLELAVEELEAISDSAAVPDGTPQVPALLRLVEYVAATVDDVPRDALQEWNKRVAFRLGIHDSALGERRNDAHRWAACLPAPVSRIQVQLSRDTGDPEGQCRCTVSLLRKDSSPIPLLSTTDSLRTAEEVAMLVRDAVESIQSEPGQKHHVPHVNVVVSLKDLDLPVDEWIPGQLNEFFPAKPLGAHFPLTLSCPEISEKVPSRENHRRRRWEDGNDTPLVIDQNCTTDYEVDRLLQHDHHATRQVVLHGPLLSAPGCWDCASPWAFRWCCGTGRPKRTSTRPGLSRWSPRGSFMTCLTVSIVTEVVPAAPPYSTRPGLRWCGRTWPPPRWAGCNYWSRPPWKETLPHDNDRHRNERVGWRMEALPRRRDDPP